MGHGGGPGINTPPNMLDAVSCWREKGIAPDRIQGRRVVAGKTELEMPLFPYPNMAGWDSEKSCFKPVVGPRAGVERVAASFRPAAAE